MYILALELTWGYARNSARQILREFDYPIFSAFLAMVLRLCKLVPLIKKISNRSQGLPPMKSSIVEIVPTPSLCMQVFPMLIILN